MLDSNNADTPPTTHAPLVLCDKKKKSSHRLRGTSGGWKTRTGTASLLLAHDALYSQHIEFTSI